MAVKSRGLSHEEKKKLQQKLDEEKKLLQKNRMLNNAAKAGSSDSQLAAREQIQNDEQRKKQMLNKEYNKLSGFTRFIYRLRSYFLNVSPIQLYHDQLLVDLRNTLRKSRTEMLTSDGEISRRFIRLMLDMYQQMIAVQSTLQTIFKKKETLALYSNYGFQYLHKDISLKRHITDFTSEAAITSALISETEPFEAFLTQVRMDIRRYVNSLHPEFINRMQSDIQHLYFLNIFSNFDFRSFFILLGIDVQSELGSNIRNSRPSPELRKHFESFISFFPHLRDFRAKNESSGLTGLITAACAVEDGVTELEEVNSYTDEALARRNDFNEFFKKWDSDISVLPFEDLVAYIARNAYYQCKTVEIKRFRLKEILLKSITDKLCADLEKMVEKLKHNLNSDAEQKLLMDLENTTLQYYSKESPVNPGRYDKRLGFKLDKEVNAIFNFLQRYYPKNVKVLFVHLVRSVLPKSSNLRGLVINQGVSFENLESRIKSLNTELSPERAWGKSLSTIIYRLEKNDTGNLAKQVTNLINEVDHEAQLLISEAIEALESGYSLCNKLLSSDNEAIKEAMQLNVQQTHNTLQEGLQMAARAFMDLQTLIQSYSRIH